MYTGFRSAIFCTCTPVSRRPGGGLVMSGTGTAAFGSVCVVDVGVVFAAPTVCPAAGAASSARASAARATARSAACRNIGREYSGRPEVGADHRRDVRDGPAPQPVAIRRSDAAEGERAERVAAVQRAVAAAAHVVDAAPVGELPARRRREQDVARRLARQ